MIKMAGRDYDHLLKLFLIGDAKVGKSSILQKYVDNTFSPGYIPTIGPDFRIKNIIVDGLRCRLQIWDTASYEITNSNSFLRGPDGIFIMYDVTSKKTFESIRNYIEYIKKFGIDPDRPIMIIGNKIDNCDKEVSEEELKNITIEYGVSYGEVSAKENINIDKSIEKMVKQIIKKRKHNNCTIS